MTSTSSPNTLGLDFDELKIQDPNLTEKVEQYSPSVPVLSHSPQPAPQDDQATSAAPAEVKEKKKPYINPERVKTGGNQRDKLSEEALTERMVRMREQNEKIKQRRMDVKADEDAFRQTQESERIRLAQNRKVQESVNRTREQNAKRKMDKIQSREWDSGKSGDDWKKSQTKLSSPTSHTGHGSGVAVNNIPVSNQPLQESDGWSAGSAQSSSQRGKKDAKSRGSVGREEIGKKSADLKSPSPTVSVTATSALTSHEITP